MMRIFSWFLSSLQQRQTRKIGRIAPTNRRQRRAILMLDPLEDRQLLSCNTISGFVYNDANNNGLFDQGETPLANSAIELRNAANVVIGTTTTNAQGRYEFSTDSTIDTTPTSVSKTATWASQTTDWQLSKTVEKFNPDLGTLTSIEITVTGSVTSDISVENTSLTSASSVTATVSGTLTLTGQGLANMVISPTANAGSHNLAIYDGTLNFTGPSAWAFGSNTASGNKSTTITDPNVLAQYQGTGTVSFGMSASATSQASGGGNLVTAISTSAQGDVTVKYNYIPSNCLKPGSYTIVQKTQPPGLLDGKESRGGSVLGGTIGTDTIPVTLGTTDLTGNNFGEITPAGISGFVYVDANNNGVKDSGETGIAGATVTITGTNDAGQSVNNSLQTGNDGSYQFTNWRPGTYTLTESQPAGYFDGKEFLGSAGGTVGSDQFSGITLTPGLLATNYNYGELLPASVGGFVYVDANNNGVKDAGEAGIAGVSVTLTGTNDLNSAVNSTQTTAADGSYLFSQMRPGTYALAQVQPSSYLDGRDAVGSTGGTLGNDKMTGMVMQMGMAGVNYNFGELLPASLSGHVYSDQNANGVRDGNEQGIAGVAISLTGTDDLGAVNLTTATDGAGNWSFGSLRPGTYSIAEAQPQGFLDGAEALGSLGGTTGNDQFSGVPVKMGESGINYDFGEIAPASLSGYVYYDANNNGVRDGGETGIGNVTVTLTGTSDQGAVNLTTTTGSDGRYAFTNLRPGTYVVSETQPGGYGDGKESVGSVGGTAGADTITGINLPAGNQAADYNFGELLNSSLAGFVYLDWNNNGSRDPGEDGLGGVMITLTGTNDLGVAVTATTSTLGDGSWSFSNLRPGTYMVTEKQPGSYLDGIDAAGSMGGAVTNDRIANISLGAGMAAVNYNFGELAASSLSGYVFVDLNNNGSQNSGEGGIPNVTVTLTGTNDLGPVNLTTQTDNNGFYSFGNLRPGTYALSETQPPIYLDGKDALGSAGGTQGHDQVTGINLGVGVDGTRYDFGEVWPATLTGWVFVDTNDNCQKEASEKGIGGATLTLIGTDDLGAAVNRTTTTAADGSYAFSNVRPGLYTVIETQPSGYLDGKEMAGNSGGAVESDRISGIELSNGEVASGYNFCEVVPTTEIKSDSSTFQGPTFMKGSDVNILSKLQFLGSPGSSAPDAATKEQAVWVDGIYRSILNRSADQNGLLYWIQAIRGGTTRQQVVQLIWNSQEHRGMQVDAFYATYLHRSADPAKGYWVSQLMNGVSEIQISRMFIASAEYQSLHADNAAFITGIYADILGRPVESSGLQFWQTTLQNGATRDNVANAILTSGEAYSRHLDRAYGTFLGRAVDQAGKQFWLSALQNNQITYGAVHILILASDEYFAMAAEASRK